MDVKEPIVPRARVGRPRAAAAMDAFIEGYAKPRREEARRLLQASVEQGELRDDVDPDIALDALYGPIYYRLLVPIGPLDAAWVDALVDGVLRGLGRIAS